MKKILNNIFVSIGVLFVLAILSIGLTVIKDGKSIIGTTKTVTEKIVDIYDNGNYDIGFRLEGDDNRYYINRGQQHGLSIEELREKYMDKTLAVSYVSQFSVLDWDNSLRHINRIEFGDEMVFNELKD